MCFYFELFSVIFVESGENWVNCDRKILNLDCCLYLGILCERAKPCWRCNLDTDEKKGEESDTIYQDNISRILSDLVTAGDCCHCYENL